MSAGNSLDLDFILDSEDLMASEIVSQWDMWNSSKDEWRNRVAETVEYVYATSTRETNNLKNNWNHSTNLPKITQIYDNLVANYSSALIPHDDFVNFEGEDEQSETFEKRKVVESYIKTKNRLSGFRSSVNSLLSDWVLYGNCFAHVGYVAESTYDEDTQQLIPGYVGPKITRISPYDIVFNPLANSFKESPKIIRTVKTLGELARDVEESPELGYEQEVLNKISKAREDLQQYAVDDLNKSKQMEFDGFGSYDMYIKSGFVEILEFYGDIYDMETNTLLKNHVVTIADRRWVIRQQPLNTWSGRPHIYHCGWRERPDNLWSMGPLDNLVGMQYRLNHLENARADAFDAMLAPDRVFVGDVEEVPGINGATDYYVTDTAGQVYNLAPDTTVLQADFQIANLQDQMELFAGAPREAMGIRSPGEKTAFEVSSLQNAASRMFQNKLNIFEVKMLEPLVNAQVEVARKNLDVVDKIKVLDDDTGVSEFLSITKDDLLANGKLVAIGARHFARQAQLTQELQQFLFAVQNDPEIVQHFPSKRLAKMWEQVLGFDKFGLYEEFGRIPERLEAQRLQNVAQEQATFEATNPENFGEQF